MQYHIVSTYILIAWLNRKRDQALQQPVTHCEHLVIHEMSLRLKSAEILSRNSGKQFEKLQLVVSSVPSHLYSYSIMAYAGVLELYWVGFSLSWGGNLLLCNSLVHQCFINPLFGQDEAHWNR